MGLEGTVMNNTSGIIRPIYVDLHKMYLHKFLLYIYLPQTVDENGQIISYYTIIRTYLVFGTLDYLVQESPRQNY